MTPNLFDCESRQQTECRARQKRADEVKPLRMEQNRIDNRLGVLFAERDKLEAALAEPGVSAQALADSGKRLKAVADQIETLEARWLELSTLIDAKAALPG